MTDDPDDGLSPADEERVRRALAAAGSGADPLPDDVAARLDRVLGELVAGRPSAPEGGDGPEADRPDPRRRRWPAVLVAAAVVSVVALGVGTLGWGSGTRSTGDTAASAGGQVASAPEGPARSEGSPGAAVRGAAEPAPLRSSTLRRDVRRVVEATRAYGSAQLDGTSQQGARPVPAPACTVPPHTARAQVIAVTLDGAPATLVVDPPTDGAREARVYACDDVTAPLAAVPVPAQ